jgi:tRNA threonylcarbamoyladenosine biosynthesis protein TsaB
MAQDLLNSCGITPKEVDAVAVAAGPGSFTGVRIGVAAAKGFAWGGEKPCYGVSTLEAMACNAGKEGYVLPVMDARRSQVYTALFCGTERVWEDQAISLAELGEKLQALDAPVYVVGDGSVLCYNTLKAQVTKLTLAPEHLQHQRAAGVAIAAQKAIDRGESGDAAALKPNYLRLSQAERERLEKEKREA